MNFPQRTRKNNACRIFTAHECVRADRCDSFAQNDFCDAVDIRIPRRADIGEIRHSARTCDRERTVFLKVPFHRACERARSLCFHTVRNGRHRIFRIPFICHIFGITKMVGEIFFRAKKITIIRRDTRIPRGIGIIINAVQTNDIPSMVFTIDVALPDTSDITAIHTEFQQKSVKKRRITLADRKIQYESIVCAMLVILRLFFMIIVVFDVSANIIVNTSDLFVIALFPKIKLIQKSGNGDIHLRFHFGCGDPCHRIFDPEIESVIVTSVGIGIRNGTAVMLDIVALITHARVRDRVVIERGDLGCRQIHTVDAEADARCSFFHLRTQIAHRIARIRENSVCLFRRISLFLRHDLNIVRKRFRHLRLLVCMRLVCRKKKRFRQHADQLTKKHNQCKTAYISFQKINSFDVLKPLYHKFGKAARKTKTFTLEKRTKI